MEAMQVDFLQFKSTVYPWSRTSKFRTGYAVPDGTL